MCPAQPESLSGASGIGCLQRASTTMSKISLCSCVLQGKAREGHCYAQLCPRGSLPGGLLQPCVTFQSAWHKVPMIRKQIRAVEVGKKAIKGANHHERLAAIRSLFRPILAAPERH
ncbi:hypothetical protein CVIRNUC_002590 [Coccomyxa viridis]|uniref:Uncharacterized protein n=1 Tax=Coccomyxa viridis TaxID=1274662 RepID=A0AAV1HWM5_9CHLO|nr:hypothetical protein CVIRNUC_002590 [Coccomyxa viridis]